MQPFAHTCRLTCALLSVSVSGCTLLASDESVLRREFGIPSGARVVRLESRPKQGEGGWFGREGLAIQATFQLSDSDFKQYAAMASSSGQWKPLPIPKVFLRRMAAIETAKQSRVAFSQQSGQALPPEGSIDNPTEQQRLASFVASLPAQPSSGLFQVRTAGNDIMRAPKTVRQNLDRDLNDFMLAMLDDTSKQILIKVSTRY